MSALAAERAVLAGDLVAAARLADDVLASPPASPDPAGPDPAEHVRAEHVRAATVLAAVLAHRGLLGRAADLHAWAAHVAPGRAAPGAVVARVGTGTPEAPADVRADVPGAGLPAAPTLRAGADALVARGVRASLRPGGSAAALADLSRAVGVLECRGEPALADDSPAALGALVALHRGEADLAASLLDRALAADLGGPAYRRRHLLLRAWAAMASGDPRAAWRHRAAALDVDGPSEARDDLVAVGLEAGLARRAADTAAMLALWPRARETVLRHSVDLWALLPLGELRVVAARLGESAWLAPHAEDADALLAALSDPPLWASRWHWCGFLSAVLAEDPAAAGRRVAGLDAAARTVSGGDALAPVLAVAARCWLDVLAGEVDADAVTAAATRLRGVGMAFDGARLAKEAAVRTTDRRVLTAMLQTARALTAALPGAPLTSPAPPDEPPAAVRATPAPATPAPAIPAPATPAPASPTAPAAAARAPEPAAPLSEREREVAALLLGGLTYREIGDRLFITAKTVEHHVGRMRQRLGSPTRAALFTDLRASLQH